MDKYEYNLKLDQMKSLCAEENYTAAAELADTINWSRVKNVNALVKAGEVYEKNQRYEESRDVLLMAYDRSPIGRTIIYRLAEVAIKMKDFAAAEEYYNEFIEIAPHDNLKYVLQYKKRKAEGAGFEELIPILEELKDREYTEEWAYELAYLYHKSGRSDACIEACDELILWFGDGPFVERALELKMLYQPLTKTQEEKYRRFRLERQGITTIGAEEMKRAGEYVHDQVEIPQVAVNTSKFNTVNLQQEIVRGMQQIMEATEKTEVSDTMDNIKKIVEEIPYLQIPREEEESVQHTGHIATDEEIDGSLKINFQEMLGEDSDGQMSLVTNEKAMIERQITGQMTIAEVLDEWEKTKRAAEAALQEAEQRKLESAKARALQEAGDIMDRLTGVIPKLDAGVTPIELLEEEYLGGAQENPREGLSVEMPQAGEFVEQPADMEVPIMEGFMEQPVEMEISQEPITEEILEQPADMDISVMDMEFQNMSDMDIQAQKDPGEFFQNMNNLLEQEIKRLSEENQKLDQRIHNVTAESDIMEEIAEIPETAEAEMMEEIAEMSEIPEAEMLEEVPEMPEISEAEMVEEVPEMPMEESFVLPEIQPVVFEDEPVAVEEPQKEEDLLVKELLAMAEAELAEGSKIAEKEIAETPQPVEEMALEVAIMEEEQPAQAIEESQQEEAPAQESEFISRLKQKREMFYKDIMTQKTQEMPDSDAFDSKSVLKASTRRMNLDTEVQDLAEEADQEIREEVIEKLTDDQKSIFSYFVPVKGMEDQLCKALTGLIHHLKKDEKASRGNLIIQGGQGCGKTVLATSIIKVLQQETGKPNGKIGKIQASALNRKDIQLMLQKVAGGCLIIEKAGDLSKETAVTLSLMLEQDSNGTLVILEDTSKGIKKALLQDSTFAKKFTEKVTVPIFTNDELVSFAKAYSEELGYEIEEMAVLALYNRISNIQRIDQATTLTEVKEIVDEAIDREAHGGMKLAFSILTAKRYSDNDRIILREKDFQ